MSENTIKESTQQFFQMFSQDPELQERLLAAKDSETFLRCCVALGKEKGYSFSTKEAEELMELIAAQHQGELSDEELGAVAGGGLWQDVKEKAVTAWLKLRGKPVVKPNNGPRWEID